MYSGKIVDEFNIEDVGKVKIRYLEMSDAQDLLELMNSLVNEKANIRYRRELGFEEQVDWVAEMLKKIEKGKRVQLVVEVDGKVLGSTSVERDEESKAHVGKFGIVLGEEIRGFGLGERAMKIVLEEAKKRFDLELVTLEVYETNFVAKKLYTKFGFEEVGRIRDAVYQDSVYKDMLIMEKKFS